MFSKLRSSQGEKRPVCPLIWVSPFPTSLQVEPCSALAAQEPPGSQPSFELGNTEAKDDDPNKMGAGQASVRVTKAGLGPRSSSVAIHIHGRKNICPENSLEMSL